MKRLSIFIIILALAVSAFAQQWGGGWSGWKNPWGNSGRKKQPVSVIHDLDYYFGEQKTTFAKVSLYQDTAYINAETDMVMFDSSGTIMDNRNCDRIFQDGTIERGVFCINDTTHVRGLYLQIWRQRQEYSVDSLINYQQGFDFVGESENIRSHFTASNTCDTIDFSSPITNVRFGDWTALRVVKSEDGGHFALYGRTPDTLISRLGSVVQPDTVSSCFFVGTYQNNHRNFQWRLTGRTHSRIIPYELFMRSPQIVWFGNSMLNYTDPSTPGGFGFIMPFPTSYLTTNRSYKYSIPYLFAREVVGQRLGEVPVFQTHDYYGQNTTEIKNRFMSYGLPLNANQLFLEGGANDLGDGQSSLAIMKSNWHAISDSACAHGMKTLVWEITPFNAKDTASCARGDSFNTWIRDTLVPAHPQFLSTNANSVIGEFRAGGRLGNFWNLQTLYGGSSHDHLNVLGMRTIANMIADKVGIPATIKPQPCDTIQIAIIGDATSRSKLRMVGLEYGGTHTTSKTTGAVWSMFMYSTEILFATCLDTIRPTDVLLKSELCGIVSNVVQPTKFYIAGLVHDFYAVAGSGAAVADFTSRGYAVDTLSPSLHYCSGNSDAGWRDTSHSWGNDAGGLSQNWGRNNADTASMVAKSDSCYLIPRGSSSYLPFAIDVTEQMDSVRRGLLCGVILHGGRNYSYPIDAGSKPQIMNVLYTATSKERPRIILTILRPR